MKHAIRSAGTLLLMGTLMMGTGFAACAEEVVEPAGYHVYENTDDYASDTWYGIARGTYLKSGTSSLTKKDSTHALCSGNTTAHSKCDRVYVRIYLDQSATAKSGTWGTIDYWTGTASSASVATASSGSYKVTKNQYYRVTGSHSAKKGTTTESTTSTTSALLFN